MALATHTPADWNNILSTTMHNYRRTLTDNVFNARPLLNYLMSNGRVRKVAGGISIVEHLSYWGGDERGSNFAGPKEDFPVSIPVGTNFPHAAGVALAFVQRGEKRVAVVMAGDGATSKGDIYEAMNIAGVWNLPVVFIINNNQWAISVPRAEQTAAETLAQKAVAAGFHLKRSSR